MIETAEVTRDFGAWARGTPQIEVVGNTDELLILCTTASPDGLKAARFVISW